MGPIGPPGIPGAPATPMGPMGPPGVPGPSGYTHGVARPWCTSWRSGHPRRHHLPEASFPEEGTFPSDRRPCQASLPGPAMLGIPPPGAPGIPPGPVMPGIAPGPPCIPPGAPGIPPGPPPFHQVPTGIPPGLGELLLAAGEDEAGGDSDAAGVDGTDGADAVLELFPPQPAIPSKTTPAAAHKMSRRMHHLQAMKPAPALFFKESKRTIRRDENHGRESVQIMPLPRAHVENQTVKKAHFLPRGRFRHPPGN